MAKKTASPAKVSAPLVRQALEAHEGLLRLAPTWVPRSFLMPGRRIKLAPQDVYALGNNFPSTFFGLEPGTTRQDVRRCLESWNQGDNLILNHSKAYRLQPGTGWLVPPCVLHAPGSLVTYEPQWGSDVFAMYQSMVEGRAVPWGLLVKDMPTDKHQDL